MPQIEIVKLGSAPAGSSEPAASNSGPVGLAVTALSGLQQAIGMAQRPITAFFSSNGGSGAGTSKTFDFYPWSPRWSIGEMVDRLWQFLNQKIEEML